MPGSLSDYRVAKWLGDFSSLWVGLHYDDPNLAGAYASEVFGGSYSRVKAPFTQAVSRSVFNTSGILFRGLPHVKLTHVSAWDAQFNGNMEFSIALPKPMIIQSGKSFQINANELAISLP